MLIRVALAVVGVAVVIGGLWAVSWLGSWLIVSAFDFLDWLWLTEDIRTSEEFTDYWGEVGPRIRTVAFWVFFIGFGAYLLGGVIRAYTDERSGR